MTPRALFDEFGIGDVVRLTMDVGDKSIESVAEGTFYGCRCAQWGNETIVLAIVCGTLNGKPARFEPPVENIVRAERRNEKSEVE